MTLYVYALFNKKAGFAISTSIVKDEPEKLKLSYERAVLTDKETIQQMKDISIILVGTYDDISLELTSTAHTEVVDINTLLLDTMEVKE